MAFSLMSLIIECCNAQCHFAECCDYLNVKCYAECRYAECHQPECHYAECRYIERHDASLIECMSDS
jgi:hypothetical protein